MLTWTHFDNIPITYLSIISNSLQKYHFPIEIVVNSLQIQKDLELVFSS